MKRTVPRWRVNRKRDVLPQHYRDLPSSGDTRLAGEHGGRQGGRGGRGGRRRGGERWGDLRGMSTAEREALSTGSWGVVAQKDELALRGDGESTDVPFSEKEAMLTRELLQHGDRDAAYYSRALQAAKEDGSLMESLAAELRADEEEAAVPTMALANDFFATLAKKAGTEVMDDPFGPPTEVDADGNVVPPEPMTQADRDAQRREANRDFYGQYCAMQGVLPFPEGATEEDMATIIKDFTTIVSQNCVDAFYSTPWHMPLSRMVVRQQLEGFYQQRQQRERFVEDTADGAEPYAQEGLVGGEAAANMPLKPMPWRDDVFALKVPRHNAPLSPREQVLLEDYAMGNILLPPGTDVAALRPFLGPNAAIGVIGSDVFKSGHLNALPASGEMGQLALPSAAIAPRADLSLPMPLTLDSILGADDAVDGGAAHSGCSDPSPMGYAVTDEDAEAMMMMGLDGGDHDGHYGGGGVAAAKAPPHITDVGAFASAETLADSLEDEPEVVAAGNASVPQQQAPPSATAGIAAEDDGMMLDMAGLGYSLGEGGPSSPVAGTDALRSLGEDPSTLAAVEENPDTQRMLALIAKVSLAAREQVPEASLPTLHWLQKATASGSVNPTSRLGAIVSKLAVEQLLTHEDEARASQVGAGGHASSPGGLLVDVWPHPQWGMESGHDGLYWEAASLYDYTRAAMAAEGGGEGPAAARDGGHATFVALHDAQFIGKLCPQALDGVIAAGGDSAGIGKGKRSPNAVGSGRPQKGNGGSAISDAEWNDLTSVSASAAPLGAVDSLGSSRFPPDRCLRGKAIAHMAASFKARQPPRALVGAASVVICVPPSTQDALRLSVDDVCSSTMTAISDISPPAEGDAVDGDVTAVTGGGAGLEESLPCNRFVNVLTSRQVRCCKKQLVLLTKGLQMLEEGGVLIYATNSLDPHQNERIVATVLDSLGGVHGLPAEEVGGEEGAATTVVAAPRPAQFRCIPAFARVTDMIDTELNAVLGSDSRTSGELPPTALQTALFEWAAVQSPTGAGRDLPPSDVLPLATRLHVSENCVRVDPMHTQVEGMFVAIIERCGSAAGGAHTLTGRAQLGGLSVGADSESGSPATPQALTVETPSGKVVAIEERRAKVLVSGATSVALSALEGGIGLPQPLPLGGEGITPPAESSCLFPPLSLVAYGSPVAAPASSSAAAVGLVTMLADSQRKKAAAGDKSVRGRAVLPHGMRCIPTSLSGTEELYQLTLRDDGALPSYTPIALPSIDLLTLLHLPAHALYGCVAGDTLRQLLLFGPRGGVGHAAGGDPAVVAQRHQWATVLKAMATALIEAASVREPTRNGRPEREVGCANMVISMELPSVLSGDGDDEGDSVDLHPIVHEEAAKVRVVCHLATGATVGKLQGFVESLHMYCLDPRLDAHQDAADNGGPRAPPRRDGDGDFIRVPFTLSFGHNVPTAPMERPSPRGASSSRGDAGESEDVRKGAGGGGERVSVWERMAPIVRFHSRVEPCTAMHALRDSISYCHAQLGVAYTAEQLLTPYGLYTAGEGEGDSNGPRMEEAADALPSSRREGAAAYAERFNRRGEAMAAEQIGGAQKRMHKMAAQLENSYGVVVGGDDNPYKHPDWLATTAARKRRNSVEGGASRRK